MKIILCTLFLILFAGCLPEEKPLDCKPDEIFDEKERVCTRSFGANSSTLSIASYFPKDDYIATRSGNVISHSITIKNDFDNDFILKWYLIDKDGLQSELGEDLSLEFDQSNFSPGDYTLTARLLNPLSKKILDQHSWKVKIIESIVPTIFQTTSSPISTSEATPSNLITATLANPDSISNLFYQWYVNGESVSGGSGLTSSSSEIINFSFIASTALSYYVGIGEYKLTLKVSDPASNLVYTSSTWDISVALSDFAVPTLGFSSLFTNTTPAPSETLYLISDIDISSGGLRYDIGNDGSLDAIDLCAQVDNISGVDGNGVFIDFLVSDKIVTSAQFVANNTPLCLGVLEAGFKKIIDQTEDQSPLSLSIVIYDKYLGSPGTLSYRGFTLIEKFDWDVILRAQNTAPSISIVDENPTGIANDATTNLLFCPAENKGPTSFLNCEVTQGVTTAFDISLSIDDLDYDPTSDFSSFKVEYFLNGKLLDGTHELSSSDCFFDFGEVTAISDYTCSLNLNAFNSKGEIDPSNLIYTISARVTDQDSPYSGGIDEKTSNTLSWQITKINDSNNPISVSASISGAVTEGSLASINLSVTDSDRDSFKATLLRCNDGTTCSDTSFITEKVFKSSSNANPQVVELLFKVSEAALMGTDSGSVRYIINVEDLPHGTYAATSASTNLDISVNNYNPDPILEPTQFSPQIGDTLIAYPGFPLTIDPGKIKDPSITDGELLRYQWYIKVATGSYTPIPGATKRVLKWSPGSEIDYANQEGTTARIILCVGDNGVDNSGASKNPEESPSCNAVDSSGGSDLNAWEVTVYSNMQQAQNALNSSISNDPDSEIAVWSDPSQKNPLITYMAYVEETNSDIVIEKQVQFFDGTKAGSFETTSTAELDQIRFPFRPGASVTYPTHIVTDLSITGNPNNKKLYIAYNSGPPTGDKTTHIRVIDLNEGKENFKDNSIFGFFENIGQGGHTAFNVTPTDQKSVADYTQQSSRKSYYSAIEFIGPASGDITFFLEKNITKVFSSGVDFCENGCTSKEESAFSFSEAVNNFLAASFQEISASYKDGGNLVRINGLKESEYIMLRDDHAFLRGDSSFEINFKSGLTHNGVNDLTVTLNEVNFVEEGSFCKVPSRCLDPNQAAKSLAEAINLSSNSKLSLIKAIYIEGSSSVKLQGSALGFNSIVSSDNLIASISEQSENLNLASVIDFKKVTPTPSTIELYDPTVGGSNLLINFGSDYCTSPSCLTDTTEMALSFKNFINTNLNQLLDGVVAYHRPGSSRVEVSGLTNGKKFLFSTPVANEPNPFIFNPNINILNFKAPVFGSSVNIQIGTETITEANICSIDCSTITKSAESFASFINQSISSTLQGISAKHFSGTGKVRIYGLDDGNYLLRNLGAKKLGNITISPVNGKWYLPFIDESNDLKVSLLTGTTSSPLQGQSINHLRLNTQSTNGIELSHDQSAQGDIIMAIKALDQKVYAYELDRYFNIKEVMPNIFKELISSVVNEIKVAISKEDENDGTQALIVGKNSGTGGNDLFSAAFIPSTGQDFKLEDAFFLQDLGDGLDLVSSADYFDLKASSQKDHFILATAADPTGLGSNYNYFLLNINVSTTEERISLDCSFDGENKKVSDNCMRVTPVSTASFFNLRPKLSNVIKDVTIGSAGKVSSENTQDVMSLGFHIDNLGAPLPVLALVNIKPTHLTTSRDANTGEVSIIPYIAKEKSLIQYDVYPSVALGDPLPPKDTALSFSGEVDECAFFTDGNEKSFTLRAKINDTTKDNEILISIDKYFGDLEYRISPTESQNPFKLKLMPDDYSIDQSSQCSMITKEDYQNTLEAKFSCKKLNDGSGNQIDLIGSFTCQLD